MFTDNLYLRSNPLIYKSRADYQKVSHHFSNNHVVVECSVFGVSNQVSVINKVDHQWSLSGLNETVASVLTNEFQETKVAGIKIKHVFTQKLLTMIIYGSCIATPISHYMYFIINNKIFKRPIDKVRKDLTDLDVFEYGHTDTCCVFCIMDCVDQ